MAGKRRYHWRAATSTRRARIKELCAAHRLEVAGLTSYVRPDEDDGVARLIDACRTLGCPRFRIFSARYDPARWLLRAPRSHASSARAPRPPPRGQRGQGAARDPFGTIVASPALAFEVLRDLDPATIGVILAPVNLVIEGGMDLRMGLDMLGERVNLVHVKNIRWEQTPAERWRWRFDELADGQCDWAEVIAALRDAGYDGWLSLENLWRVPVGTPATSTRISPTRPCRRATSTSGCATSSRSCAASALDGRPRRRSRPAGSVSAGRASARR